MWRLGLQSVSGTTKSYLKYCAVTAGANATVLRMYHAVATLTASGAIWTGGTNAQGSYAFQYDPSKSM